MHTDGIPEALGAAGEAFGFERVQTLFEAGGTPPEVHDRILGELDRFLGSESLIDDRSLVVVGRAAAETTARIEAGEPA